MRPFASHTSPILRLLCSPPAPLASRLPFDEPLCRPGFLYHADGEGKMSKTHRQSVKWPMIRRAVLGLMALSLPACSPKLVAVNILGDALARGGGVYASDEDPDLIREAIPFGLKTYESLIEVSPEHQGLLLAAARHYFDRDLATFEKQGESFRLLTQPA